MPDTIKRNKKIFEYIEEGLKRLYTDANVSVNDFYTYYVVEGIPAGTLLLFTKQFQEEITPDILNNDVILMETLKIIGIMEASKDVKELQKLLEKRKKQKPKKAEKTDFDKILGGIMKVPKPKE